MIWWDKKRESLKRINKELPLAHSLYRALVKFVGRIHIPKPNEEEKHQPERMARRWKLTTKNSSKKKTLRVIKGGFHVFERNEHLIEILKQLAGSEQSLPGDWNPLQLWWWIFLLPETCATPWERVRFLKNVFNHHSCENLRLDS